MVNSILEDLVNSADYCKQFDICDLIWDTEGYFKFQNYFDTIVDIIIVTTVKELNLNLSIY